MAGSWNLSREFVKIMNCGMRMEVLVMSFDRMLLVRIVCSVLVLLGIGNVGCGIHISKTS